MCSSLTARLERAPVVPLIQADDPVIAVATAKALVAGGLSVIEVVLRTDEAVACMSEVVRAVPEATVGAGTVLNAEQAQQVIDAGAAFIVAPGLDEATVRLAQDEDLPVFPGVATASELQRASNLGLDIVKFFPAGLAGGPAMLKALSAVFRHIRFMPTGGVSASNLAQYIALPAVIACGGSWLTPPAAIARGDYAEITRLAREAIAIAASSQEC